MYRNLVSTLICNIYCVLTYAQNISPRDSIDKLIATSTVDSITYNHITFALAKLSVGEKSDINNYFTKGLKLCEKLGDLEYTFRLYDNTAKILYFSGHKDSAKEKLNKLFELAKANNNKGFEVSARIGKIEFLIDNGERKKAQQQLIEIINEIKGTKHLELLSICYEKLSIIYRDAGKYQKAIETLYKSLSINKKYAVSRTTFANYSSLGRTYRFMGKNDSAKISYLKAEDIAIKLNNKQALSTILNNLGNLDHIEGNYENALAFYIRSLKIKEKSGNIRGSSVTYHNIGAIKFDMKSYYDAINDFQKSNSLGLQIDYKPIIVYNEQKIGNCQRELGDIDKALTHHNGALKMAQEIGFKNGIIEALQNIGEDKLLLEDFEAADKSLVKALNLARESESKPFESSILVLLSKSYLNNNANKNLSQKIADNKSLNNNIVENYLIRANELADEMNNVDSKVLALDGLSLYYTKTNNPTKNVDILKQQLSLKDSLFSKERTKAIADWETKYETAEKQKEIIQLEAKQIISKAKTKLWSIISLLLIIIISIGSYLFLKLRQARELLQNQNEELKELNLTKDKFFGIIAHDIRSPIVALESVDTQMDYYISNNKIDKLNKLGSLVGKTARHLNNLLDNLLNWALIQTKNIPLNPEKINIGVLVAEVKEIMQANIELKNIDVSVNVLSTAEITADSASLSTVFRNLLSNAIKYSHKGSSIVINHFITNNMDNFEIKDTGTGMDQATLDRLFTLDKKSQKGTSGEKGTGMGMILCKELIELNKGNISVTSKIHEGTKVSFSIPKVKQFIYS